LPLCYIEIPRAGCTNIKTNLFLYSHLYDPSAKIPHDIGKKDLERLRNQGLLNPISKTPGHHEIHSTLKFKTLDNFEEYEQWKTDATWWKFTVVREPIARFLSMTLQFLEHHPAGDDIRDSYYEYKLHSWRKDPEKDSNIINDFILRFFEGNKGDEYSNYLDHHIHPLHRFIGTDISYYDHIGQLENLWPTVHRIREITGKKDFMLSGLSGGMLPNNRYNTQKNEIKKVDIFDYILSEEAIEILLQFGYGVDYEILNSVTEYDYSWWYKNPKDRPDFMKSKKTRC
jgi:hypothetical protein